MEKVLLHVCCAPCSLGSFDKLKDKEVILFFSNSNIFPKEEWIKRFENLKKVGEIFSFKILEEEYNHEEWRSFVSGLEGESERGKRCLKCFEFNLRACAKKAKEIGADFFTTTLSVSKYKSSSDLFKVGRNIEKETGVKFLEIDFKKDAGYEKSISLSKKFNIYRQNYCGCEFSK
jgi:predicted adenine nucleotide alpha hydrolase (AANH) superfamily ATPase